MEKPSDRIFLGIDTGGTYTDAVLFDEAHGLIAKAKSETTKHDLSIGIAKAIDRVLETSQTSPPDIALVSLSTTLATNALVEGKGTSAALIMIGFDPADMEKAGLKSTLGSDPVLFLPGGHDVHGNERPLNTSQLAAFVDQHKDRVSGFAIAGYFAVRNASHELRVREELAGLCGLPVTCSHELTSKLGGPKRALTTLLNARLIPIIRGLVAATRSHLEQTGIQAPVMIVRGDGALVSAEFAFNRPIETILSGPAASLIGARYLLKSGDAAVSDIGGTTTDIAILEGGWPRIDPEGAEVGGLRTMVEAVAMRTFGLGGDSEIHLDDENHDTGLWLGPRRLVPVSLLAQDHEAPVLEALQRQTRQEFPNHLSTRFAWRAGNGEADGLNLRPTEARLLAKLTGTPQPLDTLLTGAAEFGTLNGLVSRGAAVVAGFTPSDAMHVIGEQENWNRTAAELAASIFTRLRNRKGTPIAASMESLCHAVKTQLMLQSGEAILNAMLQEDEVPLGPGAMLLLQRSLRQSKGFAQISVSLDRPLVGLGASAGIYYPQIGEMLKSECLIPQDADVANAIGAVTADVRIKRTALVTSPDGGNSFSFVAEASSLRFTDEQTALDACRKELHKTVLALAVEAGAQKPEVNSTVEIIAPIVDGNRQFIEAHLTATAVGKPGLPATNETA